MQNFILEISLREKKSVGPLHVLFKLIPFGRMKLFKEIKLK